MPYGTYEVHETLLPGWTQIEPSNPDYFVVEYNEKNVDPVVNFVNQEDEPAPTYDVHGYKWDDQDGDGLRGEESLLSGWTISIYQGESTSPLMTMETSTSTEHYGWYWFENLPAGLEGLKILHLGDAQAYITNIDKEEVQKKLKEIYPDDIDLLFMTIGYIGDIIEPSEKFLHFLNPKRAIPIHYWSKESKRDFLTLIKEQNQSEGKNYTIKEISDAKYALISDEVVESIKVISLEPADFSGFINEEKE